MPTELNYEEDIIKKLFDYVRGHKSDRYYYGIYCNFKKLSSITQSKYPPMKNGFYHVLNLEWDNEIYRYTYDLEYKAWRKGENITINIVFCMVDNNHIILRNFNISLDYDYHTYRTIGSREIHYVDWNYKLPKEDRLQVCTNCRHKHYRHDICDAVEDWIGDNQPIYCVCRNFTNFILDFFLRVELYEVL